MSAKERIITDADIQAVLNLLAGVTAFSSLNLGEYVKVIDRLRSLPLASELVPKPEAKIRKPKIEKELE